MGLERYRKQIDSIDEKLVELLNKRASLARLIAKEKKVSVEQFFDPARESKVISSVKKLANEFPAESIERIYREIISVCLNMQRRIRIAYLGPEASFTHEAARLRFGSVAEYIPCINIADIFTEIEKGGCDYGVVPIENSIEGAVTYTLDMFIDSELKICAQTQLRISHSFMAKDASLRRPNVIYSNPMVFGQCRLWLETNMPNVPLEPVSSTSLAAQLCAKDKKAACIASRLAAEQYKLAILAKDIEDYPNNFTRFFVVGKQIPNPTGKDRTSILFSIKDEVGALHDMLMPFKRNKINLTKIESRPSKKKAWDYYFFVDFDGHIAQPKIGKALKELESKCKFLKVLGSYPIE